MSRPLSQRGLSIVEVVAVIAMVGLLISFILPMIRSNSHRDRIAQRTQCLYNIKQAGLAFLIYSGDHGGQFPWLVSTNFDPTSTSGSREFTNSAEVFRLFQAASNELNTPKVLVCPSDDKRTKAPNFLHLNNRNLSYFVGLDAVESDPQMILSGDRNIMGGTLVNSHLLLVRTNSALSWSNTMHVRAGNVGLADGSVQQLTDARLNQQVAAVTNAVVRFAIP